VLKLINAKETKWFENKVISLITARIKYQVNKEEAELCLIPNIGTERSRQLVKAGINSAREFFNPENKLLVIKILRSEALYNDSLKRFK